MIVQILKFMGWVLLLFIGLVAVYFLAAKGLGLLKVRGDLECTPKTITCYLKSNGAHTDLVVPVKNDVYDWNEFIDQGFNQKELVSAKYIAFGWGDKGFYLNTPTWDDLTLGTALRAGFGLSTSAMHVTYYSRVKENDRCVKLEICETQYQQLVGNVQKKFKTHKGVLFHINTNQNYGNHDSFYEANGTYSIFYTCNVWVNEVLKYSQITSGFWTPFSSEVLSSSK